MLSERIAQNVRRLIPLFETSPRHYVSTLARLLGVHRSVADRHMRHVLSIEMLERIAAALGVPPALLLDGTPETVQAIKAKVEVNGVRSDCVAWIEPELVLPVAADTLLAWPDGNGWQVGRFRYRREAGRPVVRLDVIPEVVADTETVVAVHGDDMEFVTRLARRLSDEGYSAVVCHDVYKLMNEFRRPNAQLAHADETRANRLEPRRHLPDILIVQSNAADSLATQASIVAGEIVQTIIVTNAVREDDLVAGRFFAPKNVTRILALLCDLAPGQIAG
ncbi:helix-turn-helix domain-containing protein [Chitinimonas koreensis]|nr:helix-turn-helix domain-containing protein [Chitinimonas koreensis]